MTLIEEIKDEIKKSHAQKAQVRHEQKPVKKRRQKTKDEIAAYIAKKQAEEEARYLKQQDKAARADSGSAPKKERKPKAQNEQKPPKGENSGKAGNPENTEKKAKKKKLRQKASCSRCRPKTIKTIGLPDGGTLLIIYMPGE